MQSLEAATIYCPNYNCQTPNPETHKFCHKCRTPLPKRFLRALGAAVDKYRPGEKIAQRYVVKGDRVLLDTKPGFLPEITEDIPAHILPYLRLFPYRLHIPQAYGYLLEDKNASGQQGQIWLLEQAPIFPDFTENTAPQAGQLMPTLMDMWRDAAPIRQLNWLWQIAQLWQPCTDEGVAGSFLTLGLLRVDGPILRLLELPLDTKTPQISQLGSVWSKLIPTAQPLVTPYLEKLCEQLTNGEVTESQQLMTLLDRGMALCATGQSRTYSVATRTDTGPSRSRNEDACFPLSNSVTRSGPGKESLAIVCDGIGGHEGGNVASQLAIEAVQKHLQQRYSPEANFHPDSLIRELEIATAAANDLICQKNDAQNKQGRQRMGTTLVMSLAHGHEIYLTHVGDSRAYWITTTGCRQVTLDDDLASREVRLGYALYRDALHQAASGSLVQALGMGPSSNLHPTVGRFTVDEDSLLLLCSDGLSDNDRIDQYWERSILPALDGKLSLEEAVTRLIDLGNYYNGHDNVTVALIRCQVQPQPQTTVTPAAMLALLNDVPTAMMPPMAGADEDTMQPATIGLPSAAPTQVAKPPRQSTSALVWLGVILVLLLGMGAAAFGFKDPIIEYLKAQGINMPGIDVETNPNPSPDASTPPEPVASVAPTTTPTPQPPTPPIPKEGDFAVVEKPDVVWRDQPATTGKTANIAPNTIVQVAAISPLNEGETVWVRLQDCTSGGSTNNKVGWIPAETWSKLLRPISNPSPQQQGSCQPKSASPSTVTPSPSPSAEKPGSRSPN
ncbi:MAG TPA: protein phosphatase 2C domain-containing protein [Oscillatoriaceae cyanobacterium M33_DOE_052]|nr:protein phosphatase 2C domain-containing protein [Oscillatoriaceae cyanobacterium M33_DOE_052]